MLPLDYLWSFPTYCMKLQSCILAPKTQPCQWNRSHYWYRQPYHSVNSIYSSADLGLTFRKTSFSNVCGCIDKQYSLVIDPAAEKHLSALALPIAMPYVERASSASWGNVVFDFQIPEAKRLADGGNLDVGRKSMQCTEANQFTSNNFSCQ